jgi:hypothetical protein
MIIIFVHLFSHHFWHHHHHIITCHQHYSIIIKTLSQMTLFSRLSALSSRESCPFPLALSTSTHSWYVWNCQTQIEDDDEEDEKILMTFLHWMN